MTELDFEFDRDTMVEREGYDRWRTTVSAAWNVGSNPNGGYLLSLPLSALARTLPHPDPLTVTAHFLERVQPGPADITTETLREGHGVSTGVARLQQGGKQRVHVAASFGDLGEHDGPTEVTGERPTIPPPDACIWADPSLPGTPEITARYDLRLTPESAGWAVGLHSGRAVMEGWIRFADLREPDSRSLPTMADAFPPTVFNLFRTGWVPTLELTVHVRGRPVPGWLQCRFATRYLIDGYLEEDGELWDAEGNLVALSRQLARVRADR